MRRSPFVAALLSGSFALQLVLAGAGATCVDPDHSAGHANEGAEAHSMTGMETATEMPDYGAPVLPGEATQPGEAPCDQPVTPGDCQVLAPCAGGIFFSAGSDISASARVISRALPRPVLALSSTTIPPELPPPRA